MSTTPVFAPEISDFIIDQLSDDFAALKTCARISRVWTARSRFHLFKHISILTQGRKRTKELFKLLRSPHETMTPFIRSLSIRYKPSQPEDPIWDGPFDEWIMEAVPDLKLLTSVRSLTLHIHTNEWMVYRFLPCFQEVLTDLTIRGHFDYATWDIMGFICSYPCLERFVLHRSGRAYIGGIHAPDVPPLSKSLHTVHIDCTQETHFLRWLCSLNPIPPLRTVHLTGLNPDQLSYAGGLLWRLGSNLEHLELGLCFFHRFADTHMDLGYNSQLLSFTISISSVSFMTGDSAQQNVLQLLSTITSTDIQEVLIRDVCQRRNIFDSDFCSALAVLLKKQPFLNLRRVVISFSGTHGRAERERIIRKELEELET